MVARHPDAVGRIDADPAQFGPAPQQHPGVRRIGPHQPRLPGWRDRADIARGISGGQSGGAQAGNHDLREILAHTAALHERLMRRRIDQRRLRIEREIVLDALRKANGGVERGAIGVEILRAPIGNVAIQRDQRRGENIIGRAGGRRITAGARGGGDFAQGWRAVGRHRHRAIHLDPRHAFDRQMPYRRIDHHPHHIGEPCLGARGRDAPRRRNGESIVEQILPRPMDRLQPQIAAREFHIRPVIEARDVADVVDHLLPPLPGREGLGVGWHEGWTALPLARTRE
ncbi:hypothetical protein D9M73_126170 [compost metagenome]